MKTEEQVHKYFDDALSDEERSAMEQLIAEDPSLALTLEALQNQQQLHQASMPASMDHAFIEKQLSEIWSKIPAAASKTAHTPSFWSRLRASWLAKPVIATASAALLFAVAVIWKQNESLSQQSTMIASVGFVHSDIPGASSMIFSDSQSDWTIVWVDEPEPPTLAG